MEGRRWDGLDGNAVRWGLRAFAAGRTSAPSDVYPLPPCLSPHSVAPAGGVWVSSGRWSSERGGKEGARRLPRRPWLAAVLCCGLPNGVLPNVVAVAGLLLLSDEGSMMKYSQLPSIREVVVIQASGGGPKIRQPTWSLISIAIDLVKSETSQYMSSVLSVYSNEVLPSSGRSSPRCVASTAEVLNHVSTYSSHPACSHSALV